MDQTLRNGSLNTSGRFKPALRRRLRIRWERGVRAPAEHSTQRRPGRPRRSAGVPGAGTVAPPRPRPCVGSRGNVTDRQSSDVPSVFTQRGACPPAGCPAKPPPVNTRSRLTGHESRRRGRLGPPAAARPTLPQRIEGLRRFPGTLGCPGAARLAPGVPDAPYLGRALRPPAAAQPKTPVAAPPRSSPDARRPIARPHAATSPLRGGATAARATPARVTDRRPLRVPRAPSPGAGSPAPRGHGDLPGVAGSCARACTPPQRSPPLCVPGGCTRLPTALPGADSSRWVRQRRAT